MTTPSIQGVLSCQTSNRIGSATGNSTQPRTSPRCAARVRFHDAALYNQDSKSMPPSFSFLLGWMPLFMLSSEQQGAQLRCACASAEAQRSLRRASAELRCITCAPDRWTNQPFYHSILIDLGASTASRAAGKDDACRRERYPSMTVAGQTSH